VVPTMEKQKQRSSGTWLDDDLSVGEVEEDFLRRKKLDFFVVVVVVDALEDGSLGAYGGENIDDISLGA